MKKIIPFVIIFFIFAGLSCKKDKKPESVERQGIINLITGNVTVVAKDGREEKAKIGGTLTQGMKIKTEGKKSIAEIYFGENAVKILGDTIVEIKTLVTHLAANNEESSFYIEKGQFFSKVAQKLAKGDIYNVNTKTTTAGVRGTDFLISEEAGKSNVAVLDGSVEVLNNTRPDAKPLVVSDKEEVDVLEGKDMVKKQISADKLRMLNILLEIKAMREEIWNKMREQRAEILKAVEDQKQVNKDVLDKQREGDKALVEDQKKRDQEMIGNIKDDAKNKGEEAKGAAKSQMDDAKNVNKDAAKEEAEKQKEGMKPKIEKMKIDKDQFKSK